MQYWLVKSEPDAFSWDQQVANGVEPWTGVRNHTAKLNLKAMKKGDRAFFYHSNEGKEIVGVVEVVREAYPDPTAESGDWVSVDMKAVAPMPKPVTLVSIKDGTRSWPIWPWCVCRACRSHQCQSRTGTASAGWVDGGEERLISRPRCARSAGWMRFPTARPKAFGLRPAALPACSPSARVARSLSM